MVWVGEKMNQLFKFGIILGTICLTATMVLALTYQVTKPKIEGQFRMEEQAALSQILPEADSFIARTRGDTDYFEAMRGRNLTGYCVKATGNGYSGFIRIIAGIDTEGVIKGVRVLEHQETPGLGSKISEIKPQEKESWFLRQFIGKSAATIEVKKDIDAITGATISSKAVTSAINKAVNEFLRKLHETNR